MKIYNEIVIDMNPESSSYGETLHEDSYEYEGDMMLMKWTGTIFNEIDEAGNTWTAQYEINIYNKIDTTNIFRNGTLVETHDFSSMLGTGVNRDEALPKIEAYIQEQGGSSTSGYDPTSSEFRESVERTGGFGEIAKGYGEDPMDFDEFYGAPLEYAKEQYGTGTQKLGLKTGSSLGDIYSQAEQMQGSSGLESSGSATFATTKAAKGVMGDYMTQQKELSEQLAFKTEDFWKTTEDQFYAEYEENFGAR
jgi:hypothetical protein